MFGGESTVMKYANIIWQNTELKSGVKAVNYGDCLQFFTIDYILSKVCDNNEVVYLDIRDIKKYQGEKLILPLNWSLFWKDYMEGDVLCISEDIIPVFLAVTIDDAGFKESYMNDSNIAYLKRFEPIGCRDMRTKEILQKYEIQAYLAGCLTSVLPKREKRIGETVYLVDVPIKLKDYIPKELLSRAKCYTQQEYFSKDTSVEEIRKKVKERYEEYKNCASLVITSRLHVASPCMAWGIPVIFVKEKIDGRFEWIDDYLPLYSEKEFEMIDWNPASVDYEEKKKLITNATIKRLEGIFQNYECMEKFEDCYTCTSSMARPSFRETVNDSYKAALTALENKYSEDDAFEYSIWGISKASENFYTIVSNKYPHAKLRCVIDTFNNVEFHGILPMRPNAYQWENEMIFVLPVQASNAARNLFKEKKIPEDMYVCAGTQFILDEDLQR